MVVENIPAVEEKTVPTPPTETTKSKKKNKGAQASAQTEEISEPENKPPASVE